MGWKNIAALAILAAGLINLCGSINAAPISWNIVSSASSVSFAIPAQNLTLTSTSNFGTIINTTSIAFSFRANNPNSTATGSFPTAWTIGNKQNVSGFFTADTDFATSIKFLDGGGANQIFGIDSGIFPPLPDGSEPGSISADIATHIFMSNGLLLGSHLDLALRNVLYDVYSGVIPLTSGSFDSGSVSFGTLYEDIAYAARRPSGLGGTEFVALLGSGSYDSLESFTNKSTGAADGSVVIETTPGGYVAKLTMPFNVPVTFNLQTDGLLLPFKMNLTGTIVGTAVVPEPGTMALVAVGMAMLTPMAVRRWRKRE